ncbi:MAG: AbgT family transporter [Prevotella sp.]|nr:AbgT family transporter [Prevotella sp.]
MTSKRAALLAALLIVAQLLLVLVSWLLSATQTVGVRSLLSSEGIRWFCGRFSDVLASPLLVWLLLAAIAVGCLRDCGLLGLRRPFAYRQRIALGLSATLLLLFLVVLSALAVAPRAILLSASGRLFPSPFSASLVPALSFAIVATSLTYGIISGRYQSLRHVYESLLCGIRSAAPLFLFYVLLAQFYESLLFVVGLKPHF